MRPRLKGFMSHQRGNVTIITALFSLLFVPLCALAIDAGSIYVDSRKLQGVADLAALAAADDLNHAWSAAEATVRANGYEDVEVDVRTGYYDPARAGGPKSRFVPDGVDISGQPNGVHVTLTGKGMLFFGEVLIGQKHVDITRGATATRSEMVAFSIGSRLASLEGGVLNALLSALTGSQISLKVMDYERLLDADIDLLGYVGALHTRAGLKAGSFNDVLDAEISVTEALTVLAAQAEAQGQTEAAATIRLLALKATGTAKIRLSRLIDLGLYGAQDHYSGRESAAVRVDSLGLVRAMLELANANRQVQLNLNGNVPALAGLKIWLAIGERPNGSPWLSVTRDGSRIIRTAQMRLYIEAEAGGVGGLLNGLGVQVLKVPLLIELASAEAKLEDLHCTRPASACSVTLAVRPSIGQVTIGEVPVQSLNDFKKPLNPAPATLLGLPLVKATAATQIKLGGMQWQNVTFSAADIAEQKVKTVRTPDAVQSIATSLVAKTDINVQVLGILGIGLNGGVIKTALGNVLSAVAAPLDGVLNVLLSLLGVGLGEADVRVNNLRCTASTLVG